MSIKLKSPEEIEVLKEGGKRLARILRAVAAEVRPGVKTGALDELAFDFVKQGGDESAFLNYRPAGSRLSYPASLCVSINEEIVHGIPSDREIKDGDLVSLDLGLKHKGLFTDMALTIIVGKTSEEKKKLVKIAKEALAVGIRAAKPGKRVGDISWAIQKYVEGEGLNVVCDLAGHGVGFSPHEDPFIPNYGRAGTGDKLTPGMVLAIEPMVTAGSGEISLERDEFTFTTKDRQLASHFEATIAITENSPIILTK